MRLIWRIAKTELAVLFYSPVAWLLLVAFACQIGFDFSDITTELVKIKAMGRTVSFSMTAGVVLGLKGIYEVIQQSIYLYIPLLTMNLMSREYASGSIKLLYSTPISSLHIIGGKFLSMVVITLLFVAILALPAISMIATIPHVDLPLIASGLLAMFLLMLTYCAIGLFMSTLTSYQVVAAVATLSTLALLNYIGQIGQSSPFFREITYWLAINGRASEMVGGLICSDDVIYFIAVIALFVWLSVIKIDNEKTRYSIGRKALRYLLPFACVIAVGFISSRPAMMSFYDATHAKQRTLSEESQQVMRQLDGPMTITTYVDIFDPEFDLVSPQHQKEDFTRFKMYTRFKPEIKMKYVYYYSTPKDSTLYKQYPGQPIREIAGEVARKKKLNPRKLVSAEQLKDRIDLAEEEYRFVRVIERANGQQARIRLFDDMEYHPSEREISAAMKKLLVTPVQVGATTGHRERSIHRKGDQDYSIFATRGRFRYSMINQGFDLEEVALDDSPEIDDSIRILLVADPRTPLSEQEIATLDRYIDRGGNLIVMGDVGHQEAINPLLERLGVRLRPGIIVQPSEEYAHSLVLSRGTQVAADSIGGFFKRMIQYSRATIAMSRATAIDIVDTTRFHASVLLQTDPSQTWIELQTIDFINQVPTLDSLSGERLGSYATAVALTRPHRGKQQRIVVLGDADCFSNAELTISRSDLLSYNFTMIPGIFRWLCYGEFPVSSAHAPNRDTELNLGPMQLPYVKMIYCFGIPLLIGCCYLALYLRRRRG